MTNRFLITTVLFVTLQTTAAFGQDISDKANTFLKSLSNEQKSRAVFETNADERENWHIIPRARKGLPLKDLDEQQRSKAMDLLRASVSAQGYDKATGIMALENVLREVEGRGSDDTHRDPANYYFSIFGEPARKGAWGWRLEGHHMSMNFFNVDGAIESSTPSAFGSNPGIVQSGRDKGKEVLKQETDLGFRLVNGLTSSQLKVARFSETAPPELLTLAVKDPAALDPKGIAYSAMTAEQQKILLQLLDVYVNNYAFGFSSKLMAKIKKAGIENLSFAWAGSLKPGAGHYYRIQGPMLLIEYDNTQNNANHVHTAVRDLTNDFAEDILREHYANDHQK